MQISKPINQIQRDYNTLCAKGGGVRGGPARGKVLELLKEAGEGLNATAISEMQHQMDMFKERNPWHVCFAVGLCWGHLARLDVVFTEAVCNYLTYFDEFDLNIAKKFHLERGPLPIEQSLRGGNVLFQLVKLPNVLPTDLVSLARAQDRWLSPIINPNTRPRYIGAWNATAMFMTALFAQPALAATQKAPPPMLPPGGPIFNGLSLLHQAGVISRKPAGSELDDTAFEPGAIYENNGLLQELCSQLPAWNMIDVHSGVYMLGTRHPHSGTWA